MFNLMVSLSLAAHVSLLYNFMSVTNFSNSPLQNNKQAINPTRFFAKRKKHDHPLLSTRMEEEHLYSVGIFKKYSVMGRSFNLQSSAESPPYCFSFQSWAESPPY